MVERIKVDNECPEDVIRDFSPKALEGIRIIYFLRGTLEGRIQAESSALKSLARYPEYDQNSTLFTNVAGHDGTTGSLLIVPRYTPFLETYNSGDSMPKEGETYVALWKSLVSQSDVSGEFLMLCDNIERAQQIALDLSRRLLNFDLNEIELRVDLVSPEEFIEIARRRIMESKSVPNFILGYAGLNRLKDSSKEDSF